MTPRERSQATAALLAVIAAMIGLVMAFGQY